MKYKDYDMKNQQENKGKLTRKITSKELFKVMDKVTRMNIHFLMNVDEFDSS
jgi:hypothetical protein